MKLNLNSLGRSIAIVTVSLAGLASTPASAVEPAQRRAVGFVDRVDDIMEWIIVDDYQGGRHRFAYRDLTYIVEDGDRISPQQLRLGEQVTVLYHTDGVFEHADRVVVGPAHHPNTEPVKVKHNKKASKRAQQQLAAGTGR